MRVRNVIVYVVIGGLTKVCFFSRVNELFNDGKLKDLQLQEFDNCFIQLARRHNNVLSIGYFYNNINYRK